jgi:hypothetical protein
MGIMICSKHGRSGFVEVCSHVASQIAVGQSPKGRRFDILGRLFVCDECFNSLGLDKCIGLAGVTDPSFDADDTRWAVFDAAYEAIEDRAAICSKCFAELDQKLKS